MSYNHKFKCDLKSYENSGGKSMANTETNLKTEYRQMETNNTKVVRDYKSRLFSYIFGREETKDRTLSLYNLRANTRDFSHEIQPFLHIYFTNYYNIS